MANSPLIFGPNNAAINLQNQTLTARGELLQNDGPLNLIGYNRFENGLTTGWALGTVGTLTNGIPTGTPTFGSGASGNLSISATSTTPIDGTYSLAYVSSAATTQGNMLHTDALPVNTGLQAKVITFKFYYQAISGSSNCNFSGTSSNSFGVAVYDVTNSSWLPVAGNFAMTQGSGVGIATGTMQTNATTASVRFCVYNANATSGAITVYFDDFSLGPQTAPIGYSGKDWESYTPTVSHASGGMTNATVAGWWKKSGDDLLVKGSIVFTGTPASFTAIRVSLPSGKSIDTTKINNSVWQIVGSTTTIDSGTQGYAIGPAVYEGLTNTIDLYVTSLLTHTGTAPATAQNYAQNYPITYGTNDVISWEFSVPISGWSSNVQMSNDTDTRVVAAKYYLGSTLSITSGVDLTYSGMTMVYDTHGAFNASTGTFTAPVSGYYVFSNTAYNTAAGSPATTALYKYNGGSTNYFGAASNAGRSSGTGGEFLKAGDTIQFGVNSTASGTNTVQSGAANTFIEIHRLSGPAVIAATESVNGRYYASSTSISGSFATITYTTKDFDSHNAYSGGTLTIPVSGKYQFNAGLIFSGTYSVNQASDIAIYKNGVEVSRETTIGGNSYANLSTNLSDVISCVAGDAITIRAASAATSPSILSSSTRNFFSWARVGN